MQFQKINWNVASELGLIQRINREILHPLGLAMARDPATGESPCIQVAPDRVFAYDASVEPKPTLSADEIHTRIAEILGSPGNSV